VFTSKTPPERNLYEYPTEGELDMLPPIRVKPSDKKAEMDRMSRINFFKTYTVEYNVKVFEFGDVHKDYLHQLKTNFQWVRERSHRDGLIEDGGDDDDDDDEGEGEDANGEESEEEYETR
jgi:hypothetical protein